MHKDESRRATSDSDLRTEKTSTTTPRTMAVSDSQLLVGLSSLILPAAYVLGRTYRDTWINAVGLHASTFTADAHQILFYSYVAALHGVSMLIERCAPGLDTALGLWLFAVIALFGLMLAWFGLSDWLSSAAKRRLGTVKRPAVIDNRFTRTFAWAYLLVSAPLLFIGALLYLVLIGLTPAVVGERIGQARGTEVRAEMLTRLAAREYSPQDRFARLGGNSRGEVHLVVKCGTSGCGLMSESGSRFVTWDRIERIDGDPPQGWVAARK